jgi:hypothetical protein
MVLPVYGAIAPEFPALVASGVICIGLELYIYRFVFFGAAMQLKPTTTMAHFSLPHFGPLDPESLDAYYDVEMAFNNRTIEVDLNFENNTIDPKRLETVLRFIENIRIFDINNKGYIAKDYNNEDGDTVKDYLQHHLQELGIAELGSLMDPGTKKDTYEKQLLQKLHLVRVGIYPDSEDQFAIFDYSLGKDITNYLVVIFTDENGNLDYMTLES